MSGPKPEPRQQAMTLAQRREQIRKASELTPAAGMPKEAGARQPKAAAGPSLAEHALASSVGAVPTALYASGAEGGIRFGDAPVSEGGAFISDTAMVVPGEKLNVTAFFYNDAQQTHTDPQTGWTVYDDVQRSVHVTWEVTCPGGTTRYDTGLVVTTHSLWWATRTDEKDTAAKASFPLSVDAAKCGTAPASLDNPDFSLTVTGTVTDAGGGAGGKTLNGWVLKAVPAEQTYGCVCGDDSSGHSRPQAMRGDPVNTGTGAFSDSYTDARLPSPGVPFSLTRSYSSNNPASGPFGPGWSLPWSAALSAEANGDVTFTAEDGSRYRFTKKPDGGYAAPVTARSFLRADGSGGYLLSTPDLRTLAFDAAGRLTAARDRAGQGLVLSYTGGQLTGVTDSAGRTAVFSYSGGRLAQVKLADGRHVDYGYTDGRLTSVSALDGATTAYAYDAAGRLNSVRDPRGNYTTRNTYDAQGRVTAQQDASGATTTFSYKDGETDTTAPDGGVWSDLYAGNWLLAQYDPFGNTTRYSYDGSGNRTRITDPLGNSTSLSYDSAGHLTTLSPPAGGARSWSYDDNGNVTSATDGGQHTTSYGYDARGLLTSVKDPNGNTTALAYTQAGQLASVTTPGGHTTSYGYDAQGDLTTVTSPSGAKTTRTFDSSGRLLTSTDPRGNTAGADPAAFTTTLSYDTADRITSVTGPRGEVTSTAYDTAGNPVTVTDATKAVTRYGYDPLNRLTTVTDPAGRQTTQTYTAVGDLESRTDPAGDKTAYTHDKARHLLTVTTPRGNTAGATASAFTWAYGYDKAGRRTTVTDPLGQTTKTDYDALDRPTAVTDPLSHTRTVEYDRAGNVTSLINALWQRTAFDYDPAGRLTSVTTPLDETTTYSFDSDGNLTARTSPLGARTSYGYDSDGRRTTVVDPRGNVTGADPADYTWTTAYDQVGHPLSVTDPLGNTQRTTYDAAGNQLTSTDAAGKTTSYAYDLLNRVVTVTAPDGGATTNAYDPATGLLTARTDANNHATGYGYDTTGRTTTVTDPLGRTVTFGYDADGNRTTVTNARGQTITSTVNGAGQITAVAYSEGTPGATYDYDATGHITGVTDATGSRTLKYDQADRLTRVTAPGVDQDFTYTYNPDGNLTARTFPDNTATTYTYDKDQHPSGQTTAGKTVGYTYDPTGNLLTATTPTTTPVTETRTYDRAGRLTTTSDASGAKNYTLDANGRVTTEQYQDTGPNPRPATSYTYDPAGRLATTCTGTSPSTCTPNSTTSYTWDKAGNQLTTTAPNGTKTTNTFDAADQLTTSTTGTASTTYRYDADGNRTADASGTYTYDPAGRLTGANLPTAALAFTYDADGNRSTTTKNGTPDRTTRWDINGAFPQIATETSTTGAPIATYHTGPDGLPQSMDTPAGSLYFQHDRIGSVTTTTDATGTNQATYNYDNRGNRATTGTAATPAPFGFTGQYTDPNLPGQINLRARQYDSTTGTFTTRDPLTTGTGTPLASAYTYADGDPTNQTDPSGACPMCISALIGGVAGGIIGAGVYAWQHQGKDFSWTGLAAASGKGALIGAGAGLLAPIGGTAATALALEGTAATFTAAGVNAAVGAGYTWLVNTIQCQPTTPQDLLLGAAGGAGGTLIGPAFRWLTGKLLGPPVTAYAMSSNPANAGSARAGEQVLFGQKRADAYFSTKQGVPKSLAGRPIKDVADDLREGRMSTDDIQITAFELDGVLVSTNTRGLSALSLAGKLPTNVVKVPISGISKKTLARLRESIPGGGGRLPSRRIPITRGISADSDILFWVEVPEISD
ncbi:DUF6531 domain-containing protein [Kitasatospora sp. NPDC093550]|uniref:DUF6531 domain-containing protein n=1 Tax=Kitasatospora sp. NPDC093550 TaxID=3364089 RepID=UPI0037FB0A04